MNVLFVSIAGRAHDTFNPAVEAVEAIESCAYDRISFGGLTALGRSGITLKVRDREVTGHKIQPIPEGLPDLVTHFGLDDWKTGLRLFARGDDVLIGTVEHGILLRWTGHGFEAYGAGTDTENTVH